MRRAVGLSAALAVGLLLLAGAGVGAAAEPAMGFKVAKPEAWRQIPIEDEPIVFLTRDGGYKQFIWVQERPLSRPFQFTQRLIEKGMSPAQAAEVIRSEIAADQNIRDFKLLEEGPAEIAGQRGFRLAFIYMDADNFPFKVNLLGFIHGDHLYVFRYGATSEELFQNDIQTFQEVLGSFRLTPRK